MWWDTGLYSGKETSNDTVTLEMFIKPQGVLFYINEPKGILSRRGKGMTLFLKKITLNSNVAGSQLKGSWNHPSKRGKSSGLKQSKRE